MFFIHFIIEFFNSSPVEPVCLFASPSADCLRTMSNTAGAVRLGKLGEEVGYFQGLSGQREGGICEKGRGGERLINCVSNMGDDLYYGMDRRRVGTAVIINNLDLEQPPTKNDVENMGAVLQDIGKHLDKGCAK